MSGRRDRSEAPSPTGRGRESCGGRWQRGDLRGKVGRRAAGQDRQPEQGALALCLQRRQRRPHLLELRAGLPGIERRAAPAFEQAARQIERLLLDPQGIAGDRQLLAGAAGVGIGADGLRSDADARVVERGLDRTDVRSARLDRAANAAEQVDLVADVQACVVAQGGIAAGILRIADVRIEVRGREAVRRGSRAAAPGHGRGSPPRREGPCSPLSASSTNWSSSGSANRLHQRPGGWSWVKVGERELTNGACDGASGRGRPIVRPDGRAGRQRKRACERQKPPHSAGSAWPCAWSVLCCIAFGMKRSSPRQTT